MSKQSQPITIETSTIVRILVLILVFVGSVWLVNDLLKELVWIGVAFFLAVALDPAVVGITRRMRVNRVVAVSMVFTVFVAIIAFLGASLIPPLLSQTESLANQIPHYLQTTQNSDSYVGHIVQHYNLVEHAKELQTRLIGNLADSSGTALGVLVSVFSGLTALVTILVLAFFMLLEGPIWTKMAFKYVPLTERVRVERVVHRMYAIVAGYTNGNLIIAAGVGLITALILAIFGIPYAIPLGILSGLTTLIPIIGAFVAMLVVGGVALFTSVTGAIVIIGFLLLYTLIDGHVVRPLVFGRSLEMSPLVVMLSLLLGTALGGLIGALLAIPVVACLGVIVEEVIAAESNHPRPEPLAESAATKAAKS